MPRYRTLQEIDAAGHDVRLWCFACARGATVDGIIWQHFQKRGLGQAIDQARHHFPCRTCGARDCLILPASTTRRRETSSAELIPAWFHGMRGAQKKRHRRNSD